MSYLHLVQLIYLRDAMQVLILAAIVCVSVCHMVVLYQNDYMD